MDRDYGPPIPPTKNFLDASVYLLPALMIFYLLRNMVYSMQSFVSGIFYQEAPKGKFCMKQNITSVYEDHHIQYKTMALVSIFLYGVGLVFFLHQSFKIKYSDLDIEWKCPKKNIF